MKNNKGFTLVELILCLALIGIVSTILYQLLGFTMKYPVMAQEEYDIQNELRVLSQKVDKVIKDSSATFALHRTDHENLSDGWNYIIPSLDKTSIIEYKWNGSEHVANVIATPQEGVTYDIVFTKLSASSSDNLLQYKIIANINGQVREIQSETEALNSLQVIDRGSITYPSNALAYRTDPRPSEVSSSKAAVSMVLDKSGSMSWRMTGNDYSDYVNDNLSNPYYHSRMKKLKAEAVRLINGLATNPNIYAAIIPFDDTANNPQSMLPVWVNDTANNVLIEKINSLTANGGTNTGDGLRRGYFSIKNGYDTIKAACGGDEITVNNFMIVLVDGVTTFYSAHETERSHGVITNVEYVVHENNIDNRELEYNHYYYNGRYGGNGSDLDDEGTEYVDVIGEMIMDYGNTAYTDKEPIKVYVIGFSGNSYDYGSLRDIAMSTTGETVYYEAGDSETLEGIFTSIQKDINDSLWHIGGPN